MRSGTKKTVQLPDMSALHEAYTLYLFIVVALWAKMKSLDFRFY